MEISTVIENGKVNFVLDGKLTVQTAPDLEAELSKIGEDITSIDFDLSKVDYVASAGLRVLVAAQKLVAARDGQMRLLNPNSDVNDVFTMTGLADVFTIVRS